MKGKRAIKLRSMYLELLMMKSLLRDDVRVNKVGTYAMTFTGGRRTATE